MDMLGAHVKKDVKKRRSTAGHVMGGGGPGGGGQGKGTEEEDGVLRAHSELKITEHCPVPTQKTPTWTGKKKIDGWDIVSASGTGQECQIMSCLQTCKQMEWSRYCDQDLKGSHEGEKGLG